MLQWFLARIVHHESEFKAVVEVSVVFLTSNARSRHVIFFHLQFVERAFAKVLLNERYEGCAMYPSMETVINERAVFDRRIRARMSLSARCQPKRRTTMRNTVSA
jgi:hypothetical protein